MEVTSLPGFLQALQGPLLNVAVGVVLSFVEEYIPAFCTLSSQAKRLITGALCMVIPLLACLSSTLLGYQVNDLRYGWWPAVVAGAIAFSGATLAHTRRLSGAPAA
jgi:LytS/YehU family sensor histidine kinase